MVMSWVEATNSMVLFVLDKFDVVISFEELFAIECKFWLERAWNIEIFHPFWLLLVNEEHEHISCAHSSN